ncbi:MAG: NADP-dependent oxidoreductase [Acidimicrobiia bacterium]
MTERNRRIVLRQRPHGPVTRECFDTEELPVPEPGEGEALVKVELLSVDPTIRGWMAMDTYLPAIAIGDVIRSSGLGEVVASNNDRYPVGSTVAGLTGWQEYAVLADDLTQVIPDEIDAEAAMSVYGITGVTAYFGLLDVGRPEPGETVLVSGAAGATGSVAGQIARIKGCRVVGIAGSDEKCAWLTGELGFDAAVNYRTDDVAARIGETCPDGVDVFFDNVGGEILDAALGHLAMHGRVVMCGSISTYNDEEPPPGPRNLPVLISRRGRMEGFIVLDYLDRYVHAAIELGGWVEAGELRYAVDVLDGLDSAPDGLERLFTGANTGKVLVRL